MDDKIKNTIQVATFTRSDFIRFISVINLLICIILLINLHIDLIFQVYIIFPLIALACVNFSKSKIVYKTGVYISIFISVIFISLIVAIFYILSTIPPNASF